MKKKIAIFFVAIFVLGFISIAQAEFRCSTLFVKEGMHSEQILEHCGEPVSREVVGKTGGALELLIEKWTYGPMGGVMYVLYFKAGVLERIDSYRK